MASHTTTNLWSAVRLGFWLSLVGVTIATMLGDVEVAVEVATVLATIVVAFGASLVSTARLAAGHALRPAIS